MRRWRHRLFSALVAGPETNQASELSRKPAHSATNVISTSLIDSQDE